MLISAIGLSVCPFYLVPQVHSRSCTFGGNVSRHTCDKQRHFWTESSAVKVSEADKYFEYWQRLVDDMEGHLPGMVHVVLLLLIFLSLTVSFVVVVLMMMVVVVVVMMMIIITSCAGGSHNMPRPLQVDV